MPNPHNPVTIVTGGGNLVTAVDDGGNPVTAVDDGGNLVTLTTSGANPVTFIGGIGADFDAPFTHNLTDLKGSVISLVRGTAATVEDFEPLIKTIPVSGSRHPGSRGVLNLISTTSEDFSNAAWNANGGSNYLSNDVYTSIAGPTADIPGMNVTADAESENNPMFRNDHSTTLEGDYVFPIWLKSSSMSSVKLVLRQNTTILLRAAVTLTSSWKRYSILATASGALAAIKVYIEAAGVEAVNLDMAGAMLQYVEGQADQNPDEYVSVGVESAPYHGANIDGYKLFDTVNANTVTDNVVTEATGSAIAAATLKGLLIEEARTNRADNADALAAPDTIDLTPDGTGDFTLSVTGTAAVTVAAGTATGTGFAQATAGSPVTFNLSVTGTVTLTLDSGALTQNANGSYEYNLEAGSFATSWIPNTIAGTTRDLEEVDGDATLYKDTMTITGEFDSGVDSGTGAIIFEFSDGTANNACYFWKDASGNLEVNITVGGVEKYSEVGAWTPGTTKFAIAVSPTIGESAVYIDGVRLDATPTTDAGHVGLEGTVDEFRIGRWIDDSLALNGTLKDLAS